MENRVMVFTDTVKAQEMRKDLDMAISLLKKLEIKLNTTKDIQKTIDLLKSTEVKEI